MESNVATIHGYVCVGLGMYSQCLVDVVPVPTDKQPSDYFTAILSHKSVVSRPINRKVYVTINHVPGDG